ncbi:hypothetical protein KEM52_001683 [Ascosphaera acerosa]|nr:hypothetical protein KEM52_001683 [Ascosphaera acerosa]
MQNEIFIRLYCLTAPYHLSFVLDLLRKSRMWATATRGKQLLADLHTHTTWVVLDHLEQLVVRTKDYSEASDYVEELNLAIAKDDTTAIAILSWISRRDDSFRHLLMKSFPLMRVAFTRLIMSSLLKLRVAAESNTESESHSKYLSRGLDLGLVNVVEALERTWSSIQLHSKSWEDFFSMLGELASFSTEAARMLLDSGFLQRCLELMLLGYKGTADLQQRYLPLLRMMERGRVYPQAKVYELFLILLFYIDFSLPPVPDPTKRRCIDGKFAMTVREADLLNFKAPTGELLVLNRVIGQTDNRVVAHGIVQIFSTGSAASIYEASLLQILEEGLRTSPAAQSEPYLDASLTYCMVSSSETNIIKLIDFIVAGMDSLEGSGGTEHLSFFRSLYNVQNSSIARTPKYFQALAIRRLSDWLPPLLTFPDSSVRAQALLFAQRSIIERPLDQEESSWRLLAERSCRELAGACLTKLRDLAAAATLAPNLVNKSVMEALSRVIQLCLTRFFNESEPNDAAVIKKAAEVLAAVESLSAGSSDQAEAGSEGQWEESLQESDSEHELLTSP